MEFYIWVGIKMKNKKIVFLIEDLKFGGVEVSLINLLNNAEFREHGYEEIGRAHV